MQWNRVTTSEKYIVENPACIVVLLLQNHNFCNFIKKTFSNNKPSPNYMAVYNRREKIALCVLIISCNVVVSKMFPSLQFTKT